MTKEKTGKSKTTELFGTDGVRGRTGEFPLDEFSVMKLGLALGELLPARGCKIITGRDTRASGPDIENWLAASVTHVSPGTEFYLCGVIPTPGLSWLTRSGDFDWGIMITASHNPYTDNGIKIFGQDGQKIPDAVEEELEHIFCTAMETSDVSNIISHPNRVHAPRARRGQNIKKTYNDFLATHAAGLGDTGFKLVLDCANGAAYEMAPQVFRGTGLEAAVIHAQPDGRNINRGCGSTHLETLKEAVIKEQADLGIAFDGDGDRVLFVDGRGRSLDGDHTLYVLAAYFKETREDFKSNQEVVGTVMSNLGLEKALKRMGIDFVRTAVGDRHVFYEMQQRDAVLGGEQSGHTILKSFQSTGDGILTAIYFLKALAYLDMHPADVAAHLELYPQEQRNIDIREKPDLESWDSLQEMISAFNRANGENSRLLIRYSGTEPKIRVMMESQHPAIIEENLEKFEHLIRSTIGKIG
jgi:phosphoglucosamine mutase